MYYIVTKTHLFISENRRPLVTQYNYLIGNLRYSNISQAFSRSSGDNNCNIRPYKGVTKIFLLYCAVEFTPVTTLFFLNVSIYRGSLRIKLKSDIKKQTICRKSWNVG